jgi:hypothetical protein
MNRFQKRAAIIAGGGAIAVAATGIAYAYYSAGVSNSTTGTAGTANSTVSDVVPTGATTISGLVPGGAAVNSTVTLKNNNNFSVRISAGKSLTVTSVTGPTGCADNTVAELSGIAAIPATTLAKGATMTVSVPVSMADDPLTDQTACNNSAAGFTVTYSVVTTPVS